MSEQKNKHLSRKENVLEILKKSEQFLNENGKEKDAAAVRAQYDNVLNGEFSISVIGEFSAGKSTFLNALMGEKMLPSFSRQTTATVNFLRHKKFAEHGEAGKVYYNDGKVEDLRSADFATIKKYVSTESSLDVTNKVSHLDLYLDNKFLEDNVTLVDTPGLNGLLEGHKELTEQQMEASSAAIFLFDAHQPGSASNFEALYDLHSRVNSILLVLNQIDCISKSEGDTIENVINDLKQKYKASYPNETTIPEILPISAKLALAARSSQPIEINGRSDFSADEKRKFETDSRMAEFEERLWRYLTQGEKGRQMLLSPMQLLVNKLSAVSDEMYSELDVLADKVDQQEIEQKSIDLQKTIDELQDKIKDDTREIKNELKSAEESFNDTITADISRFREEELGRIESFDSLDDIEPKLIESKIERNVNSIARNAFHQYNKRIESIISNYELESSELGGSLKNFSIKLDNKLELEDVDLGLESFEQEISAMRDEIRQIQEALDNAEEGSARARKLERERSRFESKLQSTEDAKRWYEQNAMQMIPSVSRTTVTKTDYRSRGGLFGRIGDFFVGPKAYQISDVVQDSSERDQYISDMKDNVSGYERKISEIEAQISALAGVDSEEEDRKVRKLERDHEAARKELEDARARLRDTMKERCAKALKKQKNEIEDYLYYVSDEIKSQVGEQFDEERNSRLAAVMKMIEAPVRAKITRRQEELEMLKKQARASEADKKKRETELNEKLGELRTLLDQALNIKQDIESVKIDVIQQQEL